MEFTHLRYFVALRRRSIYPLAIGKRTIFRSRGFSFRDSTNSEWPEAKSSQLCPSAKAGKDQDDATTDRNPGDDRWDRDGLLLFLRGLDRAYIDDLLFVS